VTEPPDRSAGPPDRESPPEKGCSEQGPAVPPHLPADGLTAKPNPRLTNRMPQTDAATVALARDGNSEAFQSLVERHSRAVYRLAHRMTGNASDAEDVVQETFLKAYRQLGRFESRANFGTWLHRIAVNCSIDLIRSRPHKETSHDATDLEEIGGADIVQHSNGRSPERLMLSTEVQDRITAAMSSLSARERAAFMLRHFEGHSIDDISRSLGMKTNATKHSIFRAVRKMRAALEPFVATD